MSKLVSAEYSSLLREVKERVRAAQYAALRAVNKELVGLYWDIGRLIVGRQAGSSWGKAVVERLAADLQAEFPGVGGFSASNLWRMKGFFEVYADSEKLAPLVREISWSHNLVILERCADPLEREFYIRMTKKFGWTKNVLIHQVENQSYEKTLLGQTNFDRAVTPAIRAQAKLAVRDDYTFDFLELGDAHSERKLERALIARIEHFLRAMGGLFAFVGSQFRLEVDGEEFFIDLLFKDTISKADRERLKQASKGLLASLRDLLRPMHDWTQNTTTQAQVQVFILDNLWEALPRPSFTDEETEAVANRVYDFVWQQSASGHDLAAA